MKKKTIRTGIIGAGFAGTFHFSCLKKVHDTDVEVEGVFATDTEQAKSFAQERDMKVYDSLEKLIDKVDVIHVCTPPVVHESIAIAALEKDKFAIVEKPLTGYFGQGEPEEKIGITSKRKMLQKVREDLKKVSEGMAAYKGKFCYAENWIHAPAFKKALELMEKCFVSGSILDIRGEESHSGSHSEFAKWWRYSGGGALARLGAHPLASGLFLKHFEGEKKFGKPILVKEVWADGTDLTKTPAFGNTKGSPLVTGWGDVETWSQITLTFTDGTKGTFFAADDLLGGMESNMDIRLSNARIKIDLCPVRACQFYTVDPDPVKDVYFNEKQETKAGLSFPNPHEEWLLGYPHEIQDFMEAIAFDRQPLTGLELAKQVVEVLYAGYVSMEEGRKVSL